MRNHKQYIVPLFSNGSRSVAYDELISSGGILVEPGPHYHFGQDSLYKLEALCHPLIETAEQVGVHFFIGTIQAGVIHLPMVMDGPLPAAWVAMAMRSIIRRAGDELGIYSPLPRPSAAGDLEMPYTTLALESQVEAWPQDEEDTFLTYPFWMGMGEEPEYPKVEVTDYRAVMLLAGMNESMNYEPRSNNPMDSPDALPPCLRRSCTGIDRPGLLKEAALLAMSWHGAGFALHEIQMGLSTWAQAQAKPQSELGLALLALDAVTRPERGRCLLTTPLGTDSQATLQS